MLTPLMQQVSTVLEAQLRPKLRDYIETEYQKRNAGKLPTPARTADLIARAFAAMRLALDEAYDARLDASESQRFALVVVRQALKAELDQEFPALIVVP